jgi:hypothetical protein
MFADLAGGHQSPPCIIPDGVGIDTQYRRRLGGVK